MTTPYLTNPSIGYAVRKIDELSGFYKSRVKSTTGEKCETREGSRSEVLVAPVTRFPRVSPVLLNIVVG
jgi:hypothetical protein